MDGRDGPTMAIPAVAILTIKLLQRTLMVPGGLCKGGEKKNLS